MLNVTIYYMLHFLQNNIKSSNNSSVLTSKADYDQHETKNKALTYKQIRKLNQNKFFCTRYNAKSGFMMQKPDGNNAALSARNVQSLHVWLKMRKKSRWVSWDLNISSYDDMTRQNKSCGVVSSQVEFGFVHQVNNITFANHTKKTQQCSKCRPFIIIIIIGLCSETTHGVPVYFQVLLRLANRAPYAELTNILMCNYHKLANWLHTVKANTQRSKARFTHIAPQLLPQQQCRHTQGRCTTWAAAQASAHGLWPAAIQPCIAPICRNVNTWITTHLPSLEGWKAELA